MDTRMSGERFDENIANKDDETRRESSRGWARNGSTSLPPPRKKFIPELLVALATSLHPQLLCVKTPVDESVIPSVSAVRTGRSKSCHIM